MNTPPSIEVQDFKFVTHSKIQVFENCQVQCNQPNLVCAASRFGLVFTAYQNHVKAIQLSSIIQCSLHDRKVPVRTHQLNGNILYLSLNCDHTVLAISLSINGAFIIQFYDVTSYYKQTILLLNEVRLMCTARQISWNPCIANVVAATLADGSLWACELNGNTFNINTTENNIQAICLSWSPKGKQIVIGTQGGTLCQFKPDLKFVKTIAIPDPKGSITSVQWLSNYQFATVFLDRSSPNNAPNIIIVNAPKTGPVLCLNYEEVCYNSREQEPRLVSFLHQQAWSILLVLSLNSTEVGLLGGTTIQDVCSWTQWFLMDDGRAEIPLVGKDESYPCGLALDTGNTNQITIGDNQTLQPMPMLHLFTDRGILMSFNVLNTKSGCPSICCPPEPIRDGSGLSMFILESPAKEIEKSPAPRIDSTPASVNSSMSQNLEPSQTNPEFSFLMNKPQETSTPAKPLGLNNQNSGAKIQPMPFGKPATISGPNKADTMQPPNSSATLFLPKLPSVPVSNSLFGASAQSKVETTPVVAPVNKIPQPVENKSNNLFAAQASKTQPFSASPEVIENKEEKSYEQEDSQENREAILNLIQTETNLFFKEFKRVMETSRNINIQCGTDIESKLLYAGIKDLEAFVDEANESTQNQNSEAHAIKQTLVEAFSWISEAETNSENPLSIREHADLDLLSRHQLSAITKLLYYVKSQLTQLNKQIDEQWSDFQDKCKVRAKGCMHIPSMESLYQTLLKQGDILSRQKKLVDEILIKIKKKTSGSSISNNGKVIELSSLLKDMSVSSMAISQRRREQVLAIKSQFTKSKQEALLKVLSNHTAIKMVPVKINYNDCKSSIVLDRIKKIKDTKLRSSSSANKSNDFKTQLNEYMEKQSLLNQQNTEKKSAMNQQNTEMNSSMNQQNTEMNSSMNRQNTNVPKNLSNLFESGSKKTDATFTIGHSVVKTIPVKPKTSEANKTENLASLILEKPKATTAQMPVLNLSKPITKASEMAFTTSSVPPVSTFNFSSISTSANNQKSTPISTPASAFSVITPTFKQNPLNLGEKPETGETNVSIGTSSASIFNFPAPAVSATNISFAKPIASSANQKPKEISFGQASTETPKSPTNLPISNNASFSFTMKNDNVEGKTTEAVSNTVFSFAPRTDDNAAKAADNASSSKSFSFAIKPDNVEGKSTENPSSSGLFSFASQATNINEAKTTEVASSSTTSFSLAKTDNKEDSMPKAIPLNVTKEKTKDKEDIVTLTPVTSATPIGTSFSFASTSTFGQKPADSSPKSVPANVFGGSSNLQTGNVKAVPATKESNAVVTSAQSAFTFSLDSLNVSSSNTNPNSNSKESEANTLSNLKICSPTFANADPKASTSKQNAFGMISTNTSIASTTAATTSGTAFGFASNSMFGQSAFDSNKMSQTSIFGGSTTDDDKGKMDSSSSTNIFQQASKSNIFGGPSTSGAFGSSSVFGQQKPLDGNTTNSIFGSAPKPETNVFAGGPLKPATAMFGQQTSFGSPNTSGGSIFGGAASNSGNTGMGFTSPANTGNVFGGASTGFGSGGSLFGAGAFSGGGGSVAQGGFGSPSSMGKLTPGAFGSPPTFGSAAPAFGASPSFGSQTSFGSPSAFGASTSFGSPTNAFSNVAQPSTSGFAGQTQQSNTFENLASSNVISFGNLAQGSGMPQQPKPASFTGSSSFSSWR